MPVGTVGRCAGGEWAGSQDERVRSSGVVEGNAASVKVDIVCNVVPNVSVESGAPFWLSTNTPFESRVASTASTAEKTILQFSEVGVEKVDLMLKIRPGSVGVSPLDGEMVVNVSLVDRGSGLWNQFGSAHVLAVPVCGLVNAHLGTLFGNGVGRVLVAWVEIYVFGDRATSVNIPLIWWDLVAP